MHFILFFFMFNLKTKLNLKRSLLIALISLSLHNSCSSLCWAFRISVPWLLQTSHWWANNNLQLNYNSVLILEFSFLSFIWSCSISPWFNFSLLVIEGEKTNEIFEWLSTLQWEYLKAILNVCFGFVLLLMLFLIL